MKTEFKRVKEILSEAGIGYINPLELDGIRKSRARAIINNIVPHYGQDEDYKNHLYHFLILFDPKLDGSKGGVIAFDEDESMHGYTGYQDTTAKYHYHEAPHHATLDVKVAKAVAAIARNVPQ